MGFRRCQFFSATTGLPFFVLRFPLTILLSAYYVPYPTSILYYIILRLMLWLATRGFTYVTHYYRPMFFRSAWPLSKKLKTRDRQTFSFANIRRAKNGPCRIT